MYVHNSPLLLTLGDIIFSASFVPAAMFLIYYMTGAKWWKTPIGRMFVISQFSLLLVSVAVIMSLVFGVDYPGRDVLRLVAYGGHFIAQFIVLWTYFKIRHDHESPLPKTKDELETVQSS